MITYWLDPGKHETSVAIGYRGHLQAVVRVTSDPNTSDWSTIIQAAALRATKHVGLEVPVSYPGSASKANDLIAEVVQGSLIAGRIAERTGAPIVIVHPSTTSEAGRKGWKGQLPKPLHHRRILQELSPAEMAIFLKIKPDIVAYVQAACSRYAVTKTVTGYKAAVHNDLDAAGMLLKDEGRIT